MNDRDIEFVDQFIPIPRLFQSEATGAPIAVCLMCGEPLLEDGTCYVVEKAFVNRPGGERETIFEYALCFECLTQLRASYSKESLERIEAYFDRHVDLKERRRRLRGVLDTGPWLDRCLIKGTPVAEDTGFQISGLFDGDQLLFTELPYALGETALFEIMELLSKQTLGEIERMIDEHLGPPEAWKEVWKAPRFLPL